MVDYSAYIYLASSSTQTGWQFAAPGLGLAGFIGGIDIQPTGEMDLQTAAGTNVGSFNYDSWQLLDFVFNLTTQTYSFTLGLRLRGGAHKATEK